MLHEDPLDAEVVKALRTHDLLNRTYIQATGGSVAGVFVAWYQSQRSGVTQPHSPEVCLPGSGWIPQERREITLDTLAGPITVNRYIVAKRSERAVILYWYQTPRRVIAGEWAAKFWLFPDAILEKRTDMALVRLVVWSTQAGDEAATATACTLAKSLYPVLRQQLPR